MNEAAKLVTESLLGIDFKTIFLGGKAYTIHPPRTNILARGISYWADVDFDYDNQSNITAISQEPKCLKPIFKGLSVFVVGNTKNWEKESKKLCKYWMKNGVLYSELKIAIKSVFDLCGGQDFFDCASSLRNVVGLATKVK